AAIHGSGAAAIHGSGAAAIHGSGAAAIHGSGAAAIHGSGAAAIHGSGAAAIHGSGQPSRLLVGPVEQISIDAGFFVAVGQEISVSRDVIGELTIGNIVFVYGDLYGPGQISASEVRVTDVRYIPGATEILVTGIPSSVNYELGIARIGNLTVDYTPSLGGSDFEGIGAAITVIGIQPALGGVMISDRVLDRTDLFLRN
ncbi:MAG: hypothetical protein IID58_09705, partial [Proteobacteria bacterium]|nr:hypothetical protein [Pseudomonadota bacterium]